MTVRDITRAEVLGRIGALHDRCRECEQRKEMERTIGKLGQYAAIDRHCNKTCPVGARLQELGRHLGRGRRA